MDTQDDAQHRLVHMFYEVAFLDGRRRAGMRLSLDEEDKLAVLLSALGGDPGWVRRRFRRKAMLVTALVKGTRGVARATVLNMSPGGMLLVADLDADVGETVLVKYGRPGTVQYSFPCRVERVELQSGARHIALSFSGIPLQVCYGEHQGAVRPRGGPISIRKTA
jgi:hypothetical protein